MPPPPLSSQCLPHSKARWRHLPPASFSLPLSLKREMEALTTTLPLNASLAQTRGGGALPPPPPSSQYHQPSHFLSRSNARWRHLPPPSLSFPPSLECETEVLCHHHHLPLIASLARTRDGGTYHQPPSQYLPNARWRHLPPPSLSMPPSLEREAEVLCHHNHLPLIASLARTRDGGTYH